MPETQTVPSMPGTQQPPPGFDGADQDTSAPATAAATPTIQLPKGYEDAKPVKQPVSAAAPSTVKLPKGFEDAKPVKQPPAPEEKSAVSRFGSAFAAPFESMFHGVVDEPQDVNEVVAHTQGGQGGLAAYRAAKQLVAAHDALKDAKPGDDFRKAAMDFKNAVISYVTGNTRDAAMHALSGGLSTIEGAQPATKIALDRGRQLTEGAATGGDLATPLGSTAADVAIGAATYGAGKGFSALRGAAEAGEAGEAANAAGKVARETPGRIQQIRLGEKVAQEPAQEALRAGAKAGGAAGGVSTVQPQSLRTVLEEPINAIGARAKSLYKSIDEATGGRFQGTADKIDAVNEKLRTVTNDTEEAKLSADKDRLMWQQEKMFDEAAEKGVSKDTVAQAKAVYRHTQALKDLDAKVFKNPNIVRGNAAMGAEETINVDSAVKTLQKLSDSTKFGGSRLEQALGTEGAQALLKDMYAAQKEGITALSRQQLIGRFVKIAGLGGVGYEVLRGLFGGSR
jgi:hypothetical protein